MCKQNWNLSHPTWIMSLISFFLFNSTMSVIIGNHNTNQTAFYTMTSLPTTSKPDEWGCGICICKYPFMHKVCVRVWEKRGFKKVCGGHVRVACHTMSKMQNKTLESPNMRFSLVFISEAIIMLYSLIYLLLNCFFQIVCVCLCVHQQLDVITHVCVCSAQLPFWPFVSVCGAKGCFPVHCWATRSLMFSNWN